MELDFDVQGIMEMLPHRYPFLLVDRIMKLIPGDRIVAMKNVTINEPFFQGHFPGKPVMPGVLIIDCCGPGHFGNLCAEFYNFGFKDNLVSRNDHFAKSDFVHSHEIN